MAPTSQTSNWGQTGSYAGPAWGGGTTPAASSGTPNNNPASLIPTLGNVPADQRDAYASLYGLLKQWNLESLAPDVLQFIQQGYQSDSIQYLLTQTPAYQQRFSGNATRIKNGLAPLSAAEYLSTERAYRQVLSASGLPSTFYDSPSDYAGLVGADISPDELNKRATAAFKYVNEELGGHDPGVSHAWQDYYGVDAAHLAAHFLDPNAAQNSLDRQANAVDIAAAAARNGLSQPGQSRAEHWADMGVTGADGTKAYQTIGEMLPSMQQEAQRFGTQYDQGTAEDEFLGGLSSAQRARESLNRQEQSLWAAQSPNNGPSQALNIGGAW